MNSPKGKTFDGPAEWTLGIRDLIGGWGILLILAFLAAFGKPLSSMVHQWWSDDVYSYGFLIPVISGYLIWVHRDRLRQTPIVPNYPAGAGLLLLAIAVLLIGQAGSLLALQNLSLVPAIAGIFLLLLGFHFLKTFWVPLLYLLFMIPVWDVLTDRLHLPFQNFAAGVGVSLLGAIGIPAYQHGVYLDLPNITLEVARACSGVNYLIAVIAIGIPLAYLYLKGWPRRILLLAFAVFIAILANGLRVTLIGILAYYDLSGDLHGPYHILQGLAVSFIGYGALFAGLWVLSRYPSSSGAPLPPSPERGPRPMPVQPIASQKPVPYRWALIVLLLLLGGAYLQIQEPSPVPLSMDLRHFPTQVGEWTGSDTPLDPDVYRPLDVDRRLSRVYRKPSGETVHLYIGYFETQKQDRELINFDTETKKLHRIASTMEVTLDPRSPAAINQVLHQEGPRNTLTLFWYDLNGHITTNPYMAKAYTTWDTLSHGRNNGALILATSTFQESGDIPRVLADNTEFVQLIFPIIGKFLPQ